MEYELIIIDNGSTDGSYELIESFECKKLLNETNLGFAHGVNQGIFLADSNSDVCLLNVDAEPQKDWLKELYKTQKAYDSVGLVGPVGHGDINGFQGLSSYVSDVETKNLVGFCMLVRREVIKVIGGFDTRFSRDGRLGGFEDDDYCLRANIVGFRNFISSRSVVLHKPHQAWNKNKLNYWEYHMKNEVEYRTKYWNLLLSIRERIKSEEIFCDYCKGKIQ
jgi:GT2 family glycosyltransferase